MADLCDSMQESFPDCPETKDWCLYTKNVVIGDEAEETKILAGYYGKLCQPLQKGCAKYARAVQSITGTPATVYHALMYHDITAACASCDMFDTLDLPAKLSSSSLAEKERLVFWQYIDELNRHAHDAMRATPVRVPTTEDIAADIQRRKASTAGDAPAPGVVHQGLGDVWKRLCEARQVGSAEIESVAPRLKAFFEAHAGAVEGFRNKDESTQCAFLSAFEELGTEAFNAEQWGLADKIAGLVKMESSIPDNMMRGIESVWLSCMTQSDLATCRNR